MTFEPYTFAPGSVLDVPTLAEPPRHAALRAYLQLSRPPNLITAAANVLAGYAAAGAPDVRVLPWLVLSGVALYGGGVVLNDVFDARLDAVERPERPIPSGRASRGGAALFGAGLLALGIGFALVVSLESALLAAAIAGAAVLYDAWGKHRSIGGPLLMGSCRGMNLLLGVSAAPALLQQRWYLALFPLAYIAAITAVSRGEVHGGKRETGLLAVGLLVAVLAGLPLLALSPAFALVPALPLLVLLGARVLPAFTLAARLPEPATVKAAVRTGVLSLVLLDATIAAGYAGLLYGLGVAALLLVASRAARMFAVT